MAHFNVHLDHERPEHAGAGGLFQVISIEDESRVDYTHLVDQGTMYPNLKSLASDIAEALGIAVDDVHLDEV